MKDETLIECPNCHKNTLKKLVSGGAGLIFKGSGFYTTDYKPNSQSKSKGKSESKESTESKKTPVPETPKETKSSKPKTE